MQENLNNPLWQFCLNFYGKPGVAPIMLRLQDDYDLNINLLLLMAYCNQQARVLNHADITQIMAIAPELLAAIKAQREKRRDLKGVDDAAYSKAKAQELALEQQHIAKLYQAYQGFGFEQSSTADNMHYYIKTALAVAVLPEPIEQQLQQLHHLFRE